MMKILLGLCALFLTGLYGLIVLLMFRVAELHQSSYSLSLRLIDYAFAGVAILAWGFSIALIVDLMKGDF